jgi:putative transposase/transposase-like zinc-binding protein
VGKPRLEVADVFREHGEDYCRKFGKSMEPQQWRVMRAVLQCRTAVLGGHLDRCNHCNHEVISYNSCRNRHCPKCQSLAKAEWLEARKRELLPVSYFHVVFTLPASLRPLALHNKKVVYNLLFQAVSSTLRTIAADPKHLGAEIGFTAILHTWAQNLVLHPHVHCIAPGGGLSQEGDRWVPTRDNFFLSVNVLSRFFRRCFRRLLQRAFGKGELHFPGELQPFAHPKAFRRLLSQSCQKEWRVYAKRTFATPEKAFDYLSRYTHRIAVSNHRLLKMENGKVTFLWRDYRRGNRQRPMTLTAEEFVRRFLLHVLPKGFVRIRYYGFLCNRHRARKLQRCRQLLHVPLADPAQPPTPPDWKSRYERLTGKPVDLCPKCRQGRMVRIEDLSPMQLALATLLLADKPP